MLATVNQTVTTTYPTNPKHNLPSDVQLELIVEAMQKCMDCNVTHHFDTYQGRMVAEVGKLCPEHEDRLRKLGV